MKQKNQYDIRRKKKQHRQQQIILLIFLVGFMMIIIIIIEISNHIVIDSTNRDSTIYHRLRFQFQRNINTNKLLMTHHHNNDDNNDIINQIDNNYTNDEYISLINMILMTNDTTNHHYNQTNKIRIPYISNQKELDDYFNHNTSTILGFCTNWNHINVDIWWTHHPTYEILYENSTHQCFHRIMNKTKAHLFQKLYNIQFNNNQSDCYDNDEITSKRIYKYITGSGWGIDIAHVVDGMLYAIQNQIPVQIIVPNNWQYVTTNNINIQNYQNNEQQQNDYNGHGQHKQQSCTSMDLECYFLPHIQCKYEPQYEDEDNSNNIIKFYYPWYGYDKLNETLWLLQYATRGLQWLRYESIKLSLTVQLPYNETCTTIHVRRSDVILHQQYSRQYHSINEYINAGNIKHNNNNIISKNILILTDDSNAISEAIALYHNQKYKFYYINRPRYKNIEGGWENHIPSLNPQYEVIVLFTIFRLIKSCSILIHSKSNIANYFYTILLLHNEFIQDYNYYYYNNYHDSSNDNNRTYRFDIATNTKLNNDHYNKKQYEWKRRYYHIDIDMNKHHNLIHRINNVKTIKISKDYLNLD